LENNQDILKDQKVEDYESIKLKMLDEIKIQKNKYENDYRREYEI